MESEHIAPYPVVVSISVAGGGVPLEVLPTAHSGSPGVVPAELRESEPWFADGTMCQDVPFQCRAKVVVVAKFCSTLPAAQTSVLLSATTPLRVSCALLVVMAGLGTRAQVVPFQCSVTVWLRFCSPTAQMSLAAAAEIALRLLS